MDPTLAEKIMHLRVAIEQAEGLPPEQRGELQHALEELAQSLAGEEAGQLAPLQQLEKSLLELEAKHPDAAQLLQGLAEVLGRIGL